MTPEDELWDLLARATVRVSNATGTVLGSGVFIQPRRVLTAAHVVAEATGPLSLTLSGGRRCRIVNIMQALPRRRQPGRNIWPLPDLALLSVDDEDLEQSTPFVELTDTTPSSELLVSGSAMGLSGDIIDDRARLQYESTIRDRGIAIHKLSGNAVSPGMSGGPVLDPESGMVVGLVKADRGIVNGAFVIAGESIRDALPAEWASHLQAHNREQRWRRQARQMRYANVDASSLTGYLETLTIAHAGSPLLPDDVERRHVRQPTRVRPRRTIGTQIALDPMLRGEDDDEADLPSHAGEAFLWDPVRAPWTSVAIVAGPGMGKTWLLTHHAVSIAEQSLQRLRESPELHIDVRVPVFVSAPAFARRLNRDFNVEQVTDALSGTLKRSLATAPGQTVISAILALALEDARLVLCVDGLDEVPIDLRERLRAALAMLEPRLAQLVVSGRESARATLERIFAGEHEEFELTGFAAGDVRRFVRAWHRRSSTLLSKVERLLHDSAGLRTLAHVPLLLSFVCRLAGSSERLASTRSGLYRDVVLKVLSGEWRDLEPEATDPAVRLRLLAAAVGPLASQWRSPLDEFSRHDLESALRIQPEYALVADAAVERWRRAESYIDRGGTPAPRAPVLWELLHDGMLVESQGPQGERLLRFTHLVFGELCVAMWLAGLTADEQGSQIALHRWFDGQWSDAIPIACGVAADPSTLLQSLAISEDDPWLSQTELLANCMVEAPRSSGTDAINHLVEILVGRLNSGPVSDALAARRALTVLLTGRVAHADTRLVAALRDREITHQQHKAFAMRLLCQVGEPYAVGKCREIVADRNAPQEERDAAARAICRSGDQAAVDVVITTFATQRGTHRHLAIALASGEAASQAALALVRRRDLDQALRVSVAIEQLQANGVETAALELLDDQTQGPTSQARLVVALLRAGQPVGSERARELVDNPNVTQSERFELVHALLLRGEFSALPAAADLVIDDGVDFRLRRALAQTMASVGREGAQALYLGATSRSVPLIARLQALSALVERRHPEGCRAAAAIVTNGEGERWVQAHLLGDLLTHVPNAVDQQAVVSMLSDRELTDGELHTSWEFLAGEALQAGDVELRQALRERIKRRVTSVDGQVAELSAIDVPKLLAILASSGPSGLDLLVDIATDDLAPIDARINAAMSAVTIDVGCVDRLEGLLDDQVLSPAVRDRLAVAFAMLGALRMLPRITAMLPASEPAYVALSSVLRGETITHGLLQDGVRSGREAAEYLRHSAQVTWELDFDVLARSLEFESSSQTQRDYSLTWIAEELLRRTYARLLSLLLHSERLALFRVGGFVDSEATRDWLATWVPAYRDVAHAEATRLQTVIEKDPNFPPPIDFGGPFKIIANVAALLDEWWGHLVGRRWQSCMSLMKANQSIFAGSLVGAIHGLAAQLDRRWPANTARAYLLDTVRSDDDLLQVRRLLVAHTGPLDAARAHLSADDAEKAFGAASFAIFRDPGDAAGFFYASEAMLLAGQPDQARALMRDSAARATTRQASHGRRSLLEFGNQRSISRELIEELRDVLGVALQGGEPDPDENVDSTMEAERRNPDKSHDEPGIDDQQR